MPDAIYAKTDAGRRALQERAFSGSRAQRSLLILIDGVQTLGKLWPAIQALGLSERDVEYLAECGYIEARLPAQKVQRPAAVKMAAAVATTAGEAPRLVQRSLAAAKFYALEQISRLLGQADEDFRLAARKVTDRTSLVAWLEQCRHHIAEVAGEERAELFAARVFDLMPEDSAA